MDLPQSFDLRSLRVFVMVAEAGGMTSAAKQLGLTQSSVSQIVSNLALIEISSPVGRCGSRAAPP